MSTKYKGLKRDVALEGSFSAYEFILEGLFRLQIGFDKGRVQTGVLMLTSQRSENSKLGTSAELARAEVEMLYPTISLPVTVALLDLGDPSMIDDGIGEDENQSADGKNEQDHQFTETEEHDEPWP